MDDTSAAARPVAPTATLGGVSRKDAAAGQTAASTQRALSILKRYCSVFQKWRQRDKLRDTLCSLSDQKLVDIGITRDEIDIASGRYIDSLRDSITKYL